MGKYKAFQYVRGTKRRDNLGLVVTGASLRLGLILESVDGGVKLQIIDHDDEMYIGTILCTDDAYFETVDTTMCDLMCEGGN